MACETNARVMKAHDNAKTPILREKILLSLQGQHLTTIASNSTTNWKG